MVSFARKKSIAVKDARFFFVREVSVSRGN